MVRPIDGNWLYEKVEARYRVSTGIEHRCERDFLDLICNAPTLTPPNEWVEALEAINNAAVAYIEGGPYENDLPGMEFAVEIDRLSRDFVRPPNEPLTLEQLQKMDGPVWVACNPIEGGNGYWCLCQRGHIITPAGSIFDVKEIPHWVFYRRPPEGEEDNHG